MPPSSSTDRPIGFDIFLVIWNHTQRLETPAVHLTMARWLSQNLNAANARLLMMAFRSCGKSTLVGLLSAWILLRFPDTRILVLAAEQSLATKMAESVDEVVAFLEQLADKGGAFAKQELEDLKAIAEEGLQENARKVGAALKARFEDLQQKYDVIGDVRGEGLMMAIELVKDRRTKEPDPETTAAVFEETRKHGLIASKSGPHRYSAIGRIG